MELRSCLLFAVASSLLLAVSQAVVWGPRQAGSQGRGEIVPTIMEISDTSEQTLVDVAGGAIDPTRRFRERRQSNPVEDDSIGYTAQLYNDHHTFALVHWTGYPSEALFILTRRRTRDSGYVYSDESWLYRSLDYGHTFANDTVKWANDTIIEWYYISPFSEYLIFADRTNNRLYITVDEGDSYTRSNISFRPDRLTFQSRYANQSMKEPYSRYVLGYDSGNHSLWVSLDLGINWRKLSDNVVENRYYWRRTNMDELGTVYFEKNISQTESQLYVVRNVADGSQPVIFDPNLGYFMKNTFVLELEYMFVQKNDSGHVQQRYSSPLWVSHNRTMFRQAIFPLQTEEKHYSVVDASEGQVFIAVYHDINNTNLYLSEEEGLDYSLSLQYIISPPESDWIDGYPRFDVHVVEGIVGTYMANQKVPGSRYGASVISYDKGGEWVQLIPPAIDSSGSPTICVPPECSLHLHMDNDIANGYQSILSQDSAVGLLMALGNLGSSLSGSISAVRLYFSRDGGFTWFEVDVGFWEFQLAALGSVVVAVKKRVSTRTIRWSCDEGHTWEITDFSRNAFGINVIGMLTEREEKARHVTIFGYNYGRREWLVVDLNFTSVVPNQCAEEDYFLWVPSDERPGSRCLLGEIITYERRNSTFCCFIDPLYDRPVNRTPCTCTVEDFECDFGFERFSLNSPCTPLPWIQWPPPPPDSCSEGLNYNISSGYRKVAGDKCVQGTETYFFELVRECPALPPQGLYLRVQGQPIYLPRKSITFELTQFAGWRQSTWYLWNFNDSSVPINVTGYESGSTQTHTFTRPGNYMVTVQAGNIAGSSATVFAITIFDVLTSASIERPIQAGDDDSVPTGILLVFQASKTTQYNTDVVERLIYRWSFNDSNRQEDTSVPVISHTFYAPGYYSVSLSVLAGYSSPVQTTYTLIVYEIRECPALPPQGLYLRVQGQPIYLPGKSITFQLTQFAGWRQSTWYLWNFNDSSVPINVTGYESGSTQTHTFTRPGNYMVTVQAGNIAGSSATVFAITIFDVLTSASIERPIQAGDDDSVPTGILLVFQASKTTQYNTDVVERLIYRWSFNDSNHQEDTSVPVISHTFYAPGYYSVSLSVLAGYSSPVQTTYTLTVYESAKHVKIISDALKEDGYVEVNVATIFTAQATTGEAIPDETTYVWHMVSAANGVQFESTDNVFSYKFPRYGHYDLSVIGNHSAGVFADQIRIDAENFINRASVSYIPTIRAGGQSAMAILRTQLNSSSPYEGALSYHLIGENNENLTNIVSTETDGSLKVVFMPFVSTSKDVLVTFKVWNHISSFNTQQSVGVVVLGDYGTVSFKFPVSKLPPNYNTSQWMDDLKQAIVSHLMTYSLQPSQVEIESTRVMLDVDDLPVTSATPASARQQPRHRILKRSDTRLKLFVNVNILPLSASVANITSVMTTSGQLVSVNNGSVMVTVNGKNYTAETERRIDIIVEPGQEVVVVNWKLYSSIGGGLGAVLVLGVAVAVVLGVVIYYYRRRYNHLRVRYSRLSQAPVRFTFTQSGDMMEEDDPDISEDTMCAETDDDDQPLKKFSKKSSL